MAFVIRVENDIDTMWISKTEFDKYLNEMSVSKKEFLYQMKLSNIEISQEKKRMNAGWKDFSKSGTSAYKLNMATLPKITELLKGVQPESA
jgi:hypothetical protein